MRTRSADNCAVYGKAEAGGRFLSFRVEDDMKASHVARSAVDWGDGTEPEEFAWELEGEQYITPTHFYSSAGRYTATVTNYYEGEQCSFTQSSAVAVEIAPTVPVKESTWGAIKALYAD